MRMDRVFLGRHKFLHYRTWYRGALAGYVQEILLDRRTLSREFLDAKNVEAVVMGHVRGSRNSTTAIHKLLTMELLFRQYFDAQPSSSDATPVNAMAQTV